MIGPINNPEIKFITDQKDGETDILDAVKYENLRVFSDDQDCKPCIVKEIEAPIGGWSHEILSSLDQSKFDIDWVGDAFVGEEWVGSTEV